MGYAVLPQELRVAIVQLYAVYYTTVEIQDIIEEEFGQKLAKPQISELNGTKRELSADLADLFAKTRKAFQEGVGNVAIAHKAVQLRNIDEVERKARRAGQYEVSLEANELAAKIVGGSYEKGKNGLPLDLVQKEVEKLASVLVHICTPDQLQAVQEAWGKLGTPDDL